MTVVRKLIGNCFAFILVFLFVFSSCNDKNGTLAYYRIQGTVVDKSTKNPIPGLLVIRQATDYLLFPDTTFTDSFGKYSLEFTEYYAKTPSFKLKLVDVDKMLNLNEYESKLVTVTFKSSDWIELTPDDNLKGEALKNLDIEMNALNN